MTQDKQTPKSDGWSDRYESLRADVLGGCPTEVGIVRFMQLGMYSWLHSMSVGASETDRDSTAEYEGCTLAAVLADAVLGAVFKLGSVS